RQVPQCKIDWSFFQPLLRYLHWRYKPWMPSPKTTAPVRRPILALGRWGTTGTDKNHGSCHRFEGSHASTNLMTEFGLEPKSAPAIGRLESKYLGCTLIGEVPRTWKRRWRY